MKLTFDRAHNIAYLRLRPRGAEVETVRVSDELNVDLAPDGSVYGIELLNAMSNYALRTMGNLSWSMEPMAAKWNFRWELNEVDRRKAHETYDQISGRRQRRLNH
jgi:uncharacterized protein YuzE